MAQTDDTQNGTGKPITYRDAGVDIDAGNTLVTAIKPLVKATSRPGSIGGIGGFGGLFDLKKAGYTDPILVAANDGVGTKLKIAIETGRHDTIGIDLVAMCVNDLIVQGAEPLFFLDYLATAKLDVDIATRVIAGIAEGCTQAGCALIGGETAEMPGMYHGDDYDLAGFSVGAAERDSLLPQTDVGIGDVLIALPSSGIHSNGYSLIRRLVDEAKLGWDTPAPWHPEKSTAEALLQPTRIYVKAILSVLKSTQIPGHTIKALAHITGGGLTENIPRVLPDGMKAQINLTTWKPPPVFGWVAATGHLDDAEMLRTFNCGIGMIIIAPRPAAGDIINALKTLNEHAFEIGTIQRHTAPPSAPEVAYTGGLEYQR